MGDIVTIYCEGKKGSIDFDILERIVQAIQIKGDSAVQIRPIGGKQGAGAIINYIEQGVASSKFKLFFRDRDFDFPIPESPILEPDRERGYQYFGYRNTIENYLFDPSVFWEFIVSDPRLVRFNLHSERDVKHVFVQAADRIKFYQAARHAMGKTSAPNGLRKAAFYLWNWTRKLAETTLFRKFLRQNTLPTDGMKRNSTVFTKNS
jgi:hypothetical protein